MSNPLYDIPSGMKVVTPSNTDEIDKAYTGIWLEESGDLSVTFADDSVHIYGGLLKHSELWGKFKKINSTGTTISAGNIYLMKASISESA